jgi:hypothetical protein
LNGGVQVAKITKAQTRKRLDEASSKIINALLKGGQHIPPNLHAELMKMSNRLTNISFRLK